MRRTDLQADALTFMYAHEFVDQAIDQDELYNPLVHSIEYPTKAPLSDKIIDRNEVAEKVVFAALADLAAQRRLVLHVVPIERVAGMGWLARLLQLFGYPRQELLLQRDGSFPNSPLNHELNRVFEDLLQPGSDYISVPRISVRKLIKLLFRQRDSERDPYTEIIQWVGEVLIDEGFYIESTDVAVGAVPFKQAHPDLERMRDIADRVAEMRERLGRLERTDPEGYTMLKESVARSMKELATLHARKTTL